MEKCTDPHSLMETWLSMYLIAPDIGCLSSICSCVVKFRFQLSILSSFPPTHTNHSHRLPDG